MSDDEVTPLEQDAAFRLRSDAALNIQMSYDDPPGTDMDRDILLVTDALEALQAKTKELTEGNAAWKRATGCEDPEVARHMVEALAEAASLGDAAEAERDDLQENLVKPLARIALRKECNVGDLVRLLESGIEPSDFAAWKREKARAEAAEAERDAPGWRHKREHELEDRISELEARQQELTEENERLRVEHACCWHGSASSADRALHDPDGACNPAVLANTLTQKGLSKP